MNNWPDLGGADLTIKNNQGQEPLDILTQDDDDLVPTPTKTPPPPVKSIKKEPKTKKRKSEPLPAGLDTITIVLCLLF